MKGAEEQGVEERDKGGIFALLSLGQGLSSETGYLLF